MNSIVKAHFDQVLHHLYINPLEKCNLKCKICYTRKTNPILSNEEMLEFINRYKKEQTIETITFCGGEVMALATFPKLVNVLTRQGIFIQIITNGTIDRLDEFETPNLINLITSLDGLPTYHDKNRGTGNFAKSIAFMKKAHEMSFHLDVFSIVTHQNLPFISQFEQYLQDQLGFLPVVTYHPRKPPTYLTVHPVSNIVGETEGFDFLNREEMLTLMKTKNVFPPKDLGCYQIAVASDGKVYGCCEGTISIGTLQDEITTLIANLKQRLETWEKTNTLHNCLGCSQSEFMCGIKQYLLELQTYAA
ncbi:hypothetical protein C5B42_04510 [Candidatus Cerribacteria bacterium 'Amazon FNV 2010 28 9']|uniref:Radical SAM core domain-containing protein n=1 Tax=Candidatus Cerribacteria bacterium 'Amazon FNV 2010 28 9' TaxID=2081795 RepID=A0A317JMS9_9BACT|nr:MAG: hypothetical protein C5B42_04510 [Candidatus Cerribacteria bacterium 'Amazon FNV 2010 28 9']